MIPGHFTNAHMRRFCSNAARMPRMEFDGHTPQAEQFVENWGDPTTVG